MAAPVLCAGMPPLVNSYDESMATDAYTLAMKWHTLDVMGIGVPQDAPQGCGQDDLKGWSSQQVRWMIKCVVTERTACLTKHQACDALACVPRKL